MDDVAAEFGNASVGAFRPAILKEDLVLAELTTNILSSIGQTQALIKQVQDRAWTVRTPAK